MSPAKILILLHYYVVNETYDAYKEGLNPEFVQNVKVVLAEDSLITSTEGDDESTQDYVLTARGRAYVQGLIALPLPYEATKWVFPTVDALEFTE